ncbi:hypothetical protein LPJ72_000557 [Coemansia sp. Benny D160-2]|nr:hypothetical protein LPJ72_000557 [Coemansia sp. Benny D160-2]
MLSKGRLQIIPDSSDIILHGTPRDARCAVVSGRVVFSGKAARTVSSVVVRFRAKQEDMLNPAMSVAFQPEVTCAVVRDGQIGEAASEEVSATPGQRVWRFRMGVPGNTSETVYSPAAFVAYELVAEVRTAALVTWAPFSKTVASAPVAVKRVPAADSMWATMSSEPMNVSAIWRDRIELTSIAASRAICETQAIHVRGVLRPLAKGVRLLRAGFELRELVSGPFDGANANGPRTHTVARCARDLTAVEPDSAAESDGAVRIRMQFPAKTPPQRSTAVAGIVVDQDIQVSARLRMPTAYNAIQFDVPIGPVRVSHELAFAASVVDECGQIHNVRLSSAVYVLPHAAAASPDLPRYEHSDSDILLAAANLPAAPAYAWCVSPGPLGSVLPSPPEYRLHSATAATTPASPS